MPYEKIYGLLGNHDGLDRFEESKIRNLNGKVITVNNVELLVCKEAIDTRLEIMECTHTKKAFNSQMKFQKQTYLCHMIDRLLRQ